MYSRNLIHRNSPTRVKSTAKFGMRLAHRVLATLIISSVIHASDHDLGWLKGWELTIQQELKNASPPLEINGEFPPWVESSVDYRGRQSKKFPITFRAIETWENGAVFIPSREKSEWENEAVFLEVKNNDFTWRYVETHLPSYNKGGFSPQKITELQGTELVIAKCKEFVPNPGIAKQEIGFIDPEKLTKQLLNLPLAKALDLPAVLAGLVTEMTVDAGGSSTWEKEQLFHDHIYHIPGRVRYRVTLTKNDSADLPAWPEAEKPRRTLFCPPAPDADAKCCWNKINWKAVWECILTCRRTDAFTEPVHQDEVWTCADFFCCMPLWKDLWQILSCQQQI